MRKKEKTERAPRLFEALIPIVALILVLTVVIRVFGDRSLSGPAQVALLFGSAIGVFVAMVCCKIKWSSIEEKIKDNAKSLSSALIMLLLIGAIGSTWMLSGVVPTMIFYGIKILSPKIFLFAAVVICSIISVVTGSSWTTIATFGVALIGIGQSFGIPAPLCAGAIISGAYFGDKISPLSDTTIIASQTVGTPLFTHIKYMLYTTVPTITITLVIFLVIGFTIDIKAADNTLELSNQISGLFNISPWLLLVPVITAVLIALKLPTLITLFLAVVVAIPFMVHCQPQVMEMIAGAGSDGNHIVEAIIKSICHGSELHTGSDGLDELVCTSGMAGMLNTIWLILCASCFGGVMMGGKMIDAITNSVVRFLKTRTSMVSATALTGILCNICVSDQYLSIILNSSLYKKFYEKQGYEPRLLSRTVEDSTTVTSVLVPWNTCGMTQSTVLGVATLAYIPFCFFNYLSPVVTIIMAAIGVGIKRRVKS